MTVYTPKLLRQNSDIAISAIAQNLIPSNLAIVIGAGVSMASPTNLPGAPDVSNNLVQSLKYGALSEFIDSLPDHDLLTIADAAKLDSDSAIRVVRSTILNCFDFRTASPNYAHSVLALLMAEGKIKTLSTNWDTCIERAAVLTFTDLVACRLPEEIRGSGASAQLLKLHGCAEVESSVLIASDEMNDPPWWAVHQVGAAIERYPVVFLGIGSIAPYIRKTIEIILDKAQTIDSFWIVSPSLSCEWSELLGDQADERQLDYAAEEFLDDLLRSITQVQVSAAFQRASQISTTSQLDGIDLVEMTQHLLDRLGDYPAHLLWLWIRRGIIPSDSKPAVLDSVFIRLVLALSLIHCVSPVERLFAVNNIVTVRSEHFIIELAWTRTSISSSELSKRKRIALISEKQRNTMSQSLPCLIIACGSVGPLPYAEMPESIVDAPLVDNIIDGSNTLGDRWVLLDDLVTASSLAQLREKLGVTI